MEISSSQTLQPEQPSWIWPADDHTPVDITPYSVSKYSKGGLSYWVGAARSIGPTARAWQQRRKAPIVYLLKVGSDAIHERLYYRLARTLDLPQQHVFRAITPPHRDLVAVAIQFEPEAFFPTRLAVATKTALYRRQSYVIANAEDFWRHDVLHYYCGTADIHQAMVKGKVLFGIDAADCAFQAPFAEHYWQQYLDHYQEHEPARLSVISDMMQRIARHPELPDLIEQELRDAPGPVMNHLAHQRTSYDDNLRRIHDELLEALRRSCSPDGRSEVPVVQL